MKITWLGHSAFKLEESTGTTVVTDPYHSYVGFRMPRVAADIVTVSHGHNDHNNLDAVLEGALTPLLDALAEQDLSERLAAVGG